MTQDDFTEDALFKVKTRPAILYGDQILEILFYSYMAGFIQCLPFDIAQLHRHHFNRTKFKVHVQNAHPLLVDLVTEEWLETMRDRFIVMYNTREIKG